MSFKEKLNTLRFALSYVKNYSKRIYFYMAAACVFTSVSPLVMTFVSARLVDMLSTGAPVKSVMFFALGGVLTSALFLFGRQVFNKLFISEAELMRGVEAKIYLNEIVGKDYELLEDAELQSDAKSYKTIFSNNYGIYFNMFTNIQSFITGVLSLVLSLIMARKPLIACFKIDNSSFLTSWKPLVILLAAVSVLAVIMSLIGSKYSRHFMVQNRFYNNIYGIFKYWFDFPEQYKNGKEIRIFGAGSLINSEFGGFCKTWVDKTSEFCVKQAKYEIPNSCLQMVLMGCFYLFVALKAYAGAFSLGSFVLFVGASLTISSGVQMISQIDWILGMSVEHAAYLKRIVEFPPRMVKGTLPVEKRSDNKFEIEFKNVSFKYPGTDNYVLKNFNAHLEIGSHMAIIGRNGSGKTTFIKLLCRLYDVNEGEITLNGINIKKYDRKEYMSLFSVVFQDMQLFSVPLCQNVAAAVSYEAEKLYDCLDKAGIKNAVEKMPQKEQTVIFKDFDKNGVEISGGEAQKLALARALYKDAAFVILDEPTSSLDPMSEFEIYQRFNSFVGDKTAIYISHRLSSCRFCNEIIVFKDGRLVQKGSHAGLLADEKGEYFKLWNAQAGYYIE